MEKLDISVVVLTFNEAANIKSCLESAKFLTDDIFIVDSFSTDKTLEIAKKYTDKIYQNPWVNWAVQRNWAMDNLPISHDWIFFLDADEQVTPAFVTELTTVIKEIPQDVAGLNVSFDFYFLGHLMRFAYESPPVLRIIRRGYARWRGEGAREYATVNGKLMTIKNRLLHIDQKPLTEWIAKQTNNAYREAQLIDTPEEKETAENIQKSIGVVERPWRRFLRMKFMYKMPRLWGSFIYFFYRYIFRGGFLDGKNGFYYCFLQALWFSLLIDMVIEENLIKKT